MNEVPRMRGNMRTGRDASRRKTRQVEAKSLTGPLTLALREPCT